MRNSLTQRSPPSAWDPQALFDKATRYIQQAQDIEVDEWDYALWSSLSLELLARAALANISPVLLADSGKGWAHLYNALGYEPIESRYSPRSIYISEVFRRLETILPEFTKEHESFGNLHTGRRNSELHSGEMGFDGVKASTWQPRFYQCCEVLLTSMGMRLEDFVGSDEATVATAMINAAADESAKAVQGEIHAFATTWKSKPESDRTTLADQAVVWASRQAGHRVQCPACGSAALVFGSAVRAPVRELQDDSIVERQEYLPDRFECIACGLKLTGLSHLSAADVADRYTNTSYFDAAEYYAPEVDWFSFEDDNNEP